MNTKRKRTIIITVITLILAVTILTFMLISSKSKDNRFTEKQGNVKPVVEAGVVNIPKKDTMLKYNSKGKINILYTDEDDNPLEGVEIQIFDNNDNLQDKLYTDADGKATSKNLPLGTYYFREISAPEGVVLSSNKWEFILSENLQNLPIEVQCQIVKTDAETEIKEKVTEPTSDIKAQDKPLTEISTTALQQSVEEESTDIEFVENGTNIWRYASNIYPAGSEKARLEEIFWNEYFEFPHFLIVYHPKASIPKYLNNVSCCDCSFFRRNPFMPERVIESTCSMAYPNA